MSRERLQGIDIWSSQLALYMVITDVANKIVRKDADRATQVQPRVFLKVIFKLDIRWSSLVTLHIGGICVIQYYYQLFLCYKEMKFSWMPNTLWKNCSNPDI